jgi:hypothetical protein
MIEALLPMLTLLVPIVVAGITQVFKSIQAVKFNENRKSIIRIFAVTATFVGMLMTSIANGDEVPTQEITLYVETLVGWLAIQIPYWLAKAKHKG